MKNLDEVKSKRNYSVMLLDIFKPIEKTRRMHWQILILKLFRCIYSFKSSNLPFISKLAFPHFQIFKFSNFQILIFFLASFGTAAQSRTDHYLHGEWNFALDPVQVGEAQKWYSVDFPYTRFDRVPVPHSFSVDPRYMFYTGTAWYTKKFSSSPKGDNHVFLRFDAVFYRCKIWLNGEVVGEHEGGYTPFEFDITRQLKPENLLAIEVSNAWDTTTIPGAKTVAAPENANVGQLFPWINYGGLTRPVHLVTRAPVYISNVKINAEPDLKKGDASVQISAFIQNASSTSSKQSVNASVFFKGKKLPVVIKPVSTELAVGKQTRVELKGTIAAADLKLWNQDEPNLYSLQLSCGADTISKNFGVRKIEVSGTSLLLNGEPIKMGGCNRPLDYPGHGSMDPKAVLEKDMNLVKSGSMELSRIGHYPVSETLLDWADENGLLIITEAGNWQMTPKQLSDTAMRTKYRSQLREMMERDWNHPSVIAYSVGNEFQSQTEEGKAWVRDMTGYVKSLDASRLVTFASHTVFRDYIKKPEDEASQYVDFVSANIYGGHLKNLQHIHELYPNKPIYISEFGIRADAVKTEEERVTHLINAMKDFRQCDYLIGASVWTYNDYFSRFPGTGPNGYRAWGLVSPEREKRGMYLTWQEEFAPATIELVKKEAGQALLRIKARKDFPSYTMRGYTLKYDDQIISIRTLKPGDQQEFTVNAAGNALTVELIKPGGFVILQKVLK
jgi:beta-glucuronidase